MMKYFTAYSINSEIRLLRSGSGIIVSVLLAILFAGLIGCKGFDIDLLEREETVTSGQLRDNWNRFVVYHRPNAGLVYKLKDDNKIQLSGKWVEVASEKEVSDKRALYLTDVRRILGQDGVLFGYLVLGSRDSAFVRVVNPNTVELNYIHKMEQRGR